MAAAQRFFDKAVAENGDPDKAAIDAINAGRAVPIVVRQVKYLNNIVDQDHRAIKRVTRPMLARIDLIHMIRKGQFAVDGADEM